MLLNKENCQKIVDRFNNILDKPINIMNLEGEIIASTDKERIDAFHKGAQLCAASGRELTITENNKLLYKGCQPGINLPIYYENLVIGVVGITGEPKELKGYARLVKELVELIVVENEQRKHKELKEETKRSFFAQLFNDRNPIQQEVLKSRAHIARFNHDGPKRIVFLELKESSEVLQKQKNKLVTYIKTRLQLNEVVMDLYEDEIIIILNENVLMEAFISQLTEDMAAYYHRGFRFYISDLCQQLEDYAPCYKNTKRLVELYKDKTVQKNILWATRYKLELMLDTLTQEEKQYYVNSFTDVFEKKPKDKSYYDLLETIKIYFENNMNIMDTAEAMYVHRNTIRYRLNKFKEAYGIEVSKPYDCMKTYIAIKLYLG